MTGRSVFLDENSWLVVLGSKAQDLSMFLKCEENVLSLSLERQAHNLVSLDLVMCSHALCTCVVFSACGSSALERIPCSISGIVQLCVSSSAAGERK